MDEGKFQWDDAKAVSNDRKHKMTFQSAALSFSDSFAVDKIDESEDYGEVRYYRIAMAEGRLIAVIYTMRGEAIRIISARVAERFESRVYHEQNHH